jgi:hypothetical protein
MKSMKTMLVAALVAGGLFACSTATFAQAGGGAPGGGAAPSAPGGGRRAMTSDAMITRFQTALGETNKLSDDEITQIKPVLDTMITNTTALRADTTLAPADMRTKRMVIVKDTSDAIKAIVTPSQFAVIQPLLQRGGRRGGAGGGGGGGGGAPPAAAAPPQA